MTAMHRLLTTQDGVDLAAGKDAEYEAKRARAMKWLEKNERDLDLGIREGDIRGGKGHDGTPARDETQTRAQQVQRERHLRRQRRRRRRRGG